MNTNDPQFRQLIDWTHKMAQTPSPGDHDIEPPHPYCFGDDPCVCIQLYAADEACEQRVHAHHLARDLDDIRFGREEGLREAREAVAALNVIDDLNLDVPEVIRRVHALAAIDKLREGAK